MPTPCRAAAGARLLAAAAPALCLCGGRGRAPTPAGWLPGPGAGGAASAPPRARAPRGAGAQPGAVHPQQRPAPAWRLAGPPVWPSRRGAASASGRLAGGERDAAADQKVAEAGGGAASSAAESESVEELGRLKANAAAAWLVNLTLVVWIVWLYQKSIAEDKAQDADPQPAITAILSQQLEEESSALISDEGLKEDLRQEAAAMATVTRRLEALQSRAPARLAEQLRQQVSKEQSLLAARDQALRENMQETQRDLRIVQEKTGRAHDGIFGPLALSASGLLAGFDLTYATESISLAVLFSLATRSLAGSGDRAAQGDRAAAAASAPAAQGKSSGPQRQSQLRSTTVLRFYGRWDDEKEWVLLQSLALKGFAGSFVGSVRGARGWAGSWSDRLLTFLISRSARGLVRRRGWKRIVEQTMAEVGRTFALGYVVETAADRAEQRIPVDAGRVLLVPSASVLMNA